MEIPGSDDSSSSTDLTLFQNISHLDLSNHEHSLVKNQKSQHLKIDLASKAKTNLEQAKKVNLVEYSSMATSNFTPNSFLEISDDVTLLKQTLANLINQISTKNKEKYKKKEKIKQLESLCQKNKKKIRKMKEVIKTHEEKIINLESRLTCSPGSLSDRVEKSNWKLLFIDKNLVPSVSLRQLKNVNLTLSSNKPSVIGLPDKQGSPRLKKRK
jgi:hydroxylamine reductase (hybrid-cluster protein)